MPAEPAHDAGIIYDIGMHNGDDTEYYLKKQFEVVAVEANPLLCAEASSRFASEITAGRLRILNLAIAEAAGSARFYVKQERSPQSTLRRPEDMTDWDAVTVETAALADVVDPDRAIAFMKIDIERMDGIALDSLDRAGIRPRLISAEAHAFEILLKLHAMGYRRFRLVNGNAVPREHRARKIRLVDGTSVVHSFRGGSSGPFGEDLPRPWMSVEQVAYTWFGRQVLLGKGWYDIHAGPG